jgi:signal transduction histidine kinase
VKFRSLRSRLILAYTGLIVTGFAGLALLAGQQISHSARRDHEIRLTNEVILIARGLAQYAGDNRLGSLTSIRLEAIITDYAEKTGATLSLFLLDPPPSTLNPDQSDRSQQSSLPDAARRIPAAARGLREVESASHNEITITHRKDENGRDTIYTAAPIVNGPFFFGYVQLSEPASTLERAVYERWAVLGLGVLGITFVALLASIWLSTSLIRPLVELRESARRISRGELSHRVGHQRQDEIGEVAVAFNHMVDQVQAMIEEQRAFASNTSHELRTPLTTMRLRTEALRHDITLDEEDRQRYIIEVDEELFRLSGLVEDLILLSRFDAGHAQVGEERIDLVRLARSLQQSTVLHAADKQITLELVVNSDEPVLMGASLNHMTVLCRNLLDNAIKYTPPGGFVTWQIGVDGQAAVITVQDTGHGIAPENLPRVFDRFYRADKSRSRAVQGTGLGLSLVKSIIDTYGGQIKIESPGLSKGTTVTIHLPMAMSLDQNSTQQL